MELDDLMLHYLNNIKSRRKTSCSYATRIRILGTVTLIRPQDSRAAYCSSVFILVINCSVSLADGLLRATKALNRLSSIAAVRVLSRLRISVTAFAGEEHDGDADGEGKGKG
eukprot:scaffold80122_cov71-Cyclotella_meneghiniana.AAC.3